MATKSERHDRKMTLVVPPEREILEALQAEAVKAYGEGAGPVRLAIKRAQKSVYRLRVGIETPAGDAEMRVVGKLFRPEFRIERMVAAHDRLNQAGLQTGSTGGIAVPRVYGVARNMMLMEHVEGDTLRSRFLASGDLALASLLARAIAALHAAPPSEGNTRAATDRILLHPTLLPRLAEERPALRARADVLAGSAIDALERIGPNERTAIHGDFHWGQVLVTDEGFAYLIDITPGWTGDPAMDIGNLLGQLEKHREASWFPSFREAFLAEYLALRPGESMARVRVHQALTLVRTGAKYAIGEPEDGHMTAEAMFDRAAELLAEADGAAAP